MTDIALTDPTSPAPLAALAAYFAELDRRFPGGFDPGAPADPALYRAPNGAFLLAMSEAPLGCVALTRDGPQRGEVKRLWVAPPARGQGLARRLREGIEGCARTLHLHELRLDTNGTLTEAVALYTALGWTAIPRYNDNPYAHHWFAKSLARV